MPAMVLLGNKKDMEERHWKIDHDDAKNVGLVSSTRIMSEAKEY